MASCNHLISCKRGSRAAGALTSFPRARRLRDDSRSNKEVLGYLEAENEYADAYFEQLQPLVDSLADSMSDALPAVEVAQVRPCSAHVSGSRPKRRLPDSYTFKMLSVAVLFKWRSGSFSLHAHRHAV